MPACRSAYLLTIRQRDWVGAVLLGVACVCGSWFASPHRSSATAEVTGLRSPPAPSPEDDQSLRDQQERPTRSPSPALDLECRQRADRVRATLGDSSTVVIAPPWVIVSRLPATELSGLVDRLILPFSTAVQREYGLAAPVRPTTICLAADEAEYLRWSRLFAGCAPPSPAGFFERARRVVVLSPVSRDEALRHEVTHVLLSEVGSYLPLWLSEGIAALHEAGTLDAQQGLFLPDRRRRADPVFAARQRGDLPPLVQLLDDSYAQREAELFYAHARHWCLCLHTAGSLQSALQLAANGRGSLTNDEWQLRVLAGERLPQTAEAEFRAWLDRLSVANASDFNR